MIVWVTPTHLSSITWVEVLLHFSDGGVVLLFYLLSCSGRHLKVAHLLPLDLFQGGEGSQSQQYVRGDREHLEQVTRPSQGHILQVLLTN